jgi:hypothetical protein
MPTHTPYNNIKVHGGLAPPETLMVTGCLNYTTGRTIYCRVTPENPYRHQLQSLLIIVQGKTSQAISDAPPQLIVYLGALR